MMTMIIWNVVLTVGIIFIAVRLDKLWHLHKTNSFDGEDLRTRFTRSHWG